MLGLAGCGGEVAGPGEEPVDAGPDAYGVNARDAYAGAYDGGDRVTPHDGDVLSAMTLTVVYVGEASEGGAPSVDGLVDWMLGSAYWGHLTEYGVGPGTRAGSVRVPLGALDMEGKVSGGLIDSLDLNQSIHALLHTAAVPPAQAYLVFLPEGVNVSLGTRGTYTFRTCVDESGYHAFDGQEPYAVMPPCDKGRSSFAIAHELVEMATDPGFHGWYSDADQPKNGGEIADFCILPAVVDVDAWTVSKLWSNQVSGCVP